MSTNKKLQSALELLSTYGFMLSLVAIILLILFSISNPISSVVPNQCNAYGISCQRIIYAANSVSNTANIILYLNNSESSPESINAANVIINGKAFPGPCLNYSRRGTFLQPGKGGTCTVTISPSISIGKRVAGQFNVSAQICNSAVSSFSESTCSYLPITYTGTFVLVTRTYSPLVLNLAFQEGTQITEGQTDTLTASTSVVGDKISIYECSGSGCTLPSTPLVSGTTTATYNVGGLSPGTYEVDACDTTQNICSKTSTFTVLVQCYALTLSGSGTQSASPTSSGGCPANEYASGSSVSITSTPPSGYIFSSWSGSGTGSYTGTNNPATITMSSAITETANTNECFALTFSGSGTQSASPTSSGGCPANEYTSGTSVSITSTPPSGYIFSSWSGSGTGSYTGTNNPATITMNSAITETANYNQCFALTLASSPLSAGTESQSGASGSCATDSYTSGTSVTITATPTSGNYFSDWSSECGTSSSCTFSMPASSLSLTASYTQVDVIYDQAVSIPSGSIQNPVSTTLDSQHAIILHLSNIVTQQDSSSYSLVALQDTSKTGTYGPYAAGYGTSWPWSTSSDSFYGSPAYTSVGSGTCGGCTLSAVTISLVPSGGSFIAYYAFSDIPDTQAATGSGMSVLASGSSLNMADGDTLWLLLQNTYPNNGQPLTGTVEVDVVPQGY